MSDKLIEAALALWAPRFVFRGVDHNDFVRTTSALQSWAEWHSAWKALGDRHAKLALEAAARGADRTAGEGWLHASLAYHFARYLWDVPEEYETTSRLCVAASREALGRLDPSWQRIEVPYRGSLIAGNLRRPPGIDRPPLVIIVPGLDSTKEEFFTWERFYLERGMATLSIDGPGQGEGGELAIEPGYEKPMAAVLDHLASHPDLALDLERVGAVGVSMGGYYVPRALALEPRLRAGVAVAGFYSAGDNWDLWPPMIVRKFMKHTQVGWEADARAVAGRMTLEGVAELIRQPLLIVFGDRDGVSSVEGQRRLEAEAPHALLWLFEGGNHGVTNYPYLHAGPAADWMKVRLMASGLSS